MSKLESIVISPDKEKEVKKEWEDSVVKTWRTCVPIAPKMLLDFKVTMLEIYASTVGQVVIMTPFWRGKKFTDAITRHEFLHYSLYPLDMFRGINDLTLARKMLMDDLKIVDIKKLEYGIREIQFIQNVLGDYLIHLQMAERNKDEWEVLWEHLVQGGKFEADKVKDRDTTFQLYISAYHFMNKDIPEFQTKDKASIENAQKISDLVLNCRKGIVSKPYAVKELAKIFHKYIKEDEEKGTGDPGEPKCPKCGTNDFEIIKVLKDEDGNKRT